MIAIPSSRPKPIIDSSGAYRRIADFVGQLVPTGLSDVRRELITSKNRIDPLDESLLKDPRVRTKMWKDPVVAKARMLRERMLAGTETYFDAKRQSKALVPYFERLWAETPRELQGRINLARAVFDGDSWLQMRGREQQLRISPDKELRKWWTIGALTHIPGEQIRIGWRDETLVTPQGDTYQARKYYYAIYDAERLVPTWLEVENPQHYMMFSYGANGYTAGYGDGVQNSIFYYWRMKTRMLEKLAQGLDRYGTPWIVGMLKDGYGSANAGGTETPSVEERRDAFLSEVNNMRAEGGNVLALDADDKITLLDLNGPATEAMARMLEYLDRCMVEAILVASETTGGAGDVGSYAKAEIQQGNTNIIVSGDRMMLEESMHAGTMALWHYNYQNFLELTDAETGTPLAMLEPPRRRIGKEAEDDLEQNAQILKAAQEIGLKIDEEQAYLKLQLDKPGPNSTVLPPPGAAGGLGTPAVNPMNGQPMLPAPEYSGPGMSMSEPRRGIPSRQMVKLKVDPRSEMPDSALTFADARRNGLGGMLKYIREGAAAAGVN